MESIDTSRFHQPIRKIKVGNDIKDCFVYTTGQTLRIPIDGGKVELKIHTIKLDEFALYEKDEFIYDVYITNTDNIEPVKWQSFPIKHIASIEYNIL